MWRELCVRTMVLLLSLVLWYYYIGTAGETRKAEDVQVQLLTRCLGHMGVDAALNCSSMRTMCQFALHAHNNVLLIDCVFFIGAFCMCVSVSLRWLKIHKFWIWIRV